jgi:hypothetical protein
MYHEITLKATAAFWTRQTLVIVLLNFFPSEILEVRDVVGCVPPVFGSLGFGNDFGISTGEKARFIL